MAGLTPKQRKFIEAYTGNGTEAARLAGYAGSDAVLNQVASENLRKPQIAAAIKARESGTLAGLIATRQDRQKFWTSVMNDRDMGGFERLKASELLGKSEADFVDRHEVNGSLNVSIAINGITAPHQEKP